MGQTHEAWVVRINGQGSQLTGNLSIQMRSNEVKLPDINKKLDT